MLIKTRLFHRALEDNEEISEIVLNEDKSPSTKEGVQFSDLVYSNCHFLLMNKIFINYYQTDKGQRSVCDFIDEKTQDKNSDIKKKIIDPQYQNVFIDDVTSIFICRLWDGFVTYLEKICKLLGKTNGPWSVEALTTFLEKQKIILYKTQEDREQINLIQAYRNVHVHSYGFCDEKRTEFFGLESKEHYLVFRDFDKLNSLAMFLHGDVFQNIDNQVKQKLCNRKS